MAKSHLTDLKKTFCGLSMGSAGPGGLMICMILLFMTGTPKGSTKSGFMKKLPWCRV